MLIVDFGLIISFNYGGILRIIYPQNLEKIERIGVNTMLF